MPQESESGPASLAEPIASAKALCVDDAEAPPDSEALTDQHLDVYATKNGQWNPEHGDIEIPGRLGVPALWRCLLDPDRQGSGPLLAVVATAKPAPPAPSAPRTVGTEPSRLRRLRRAPKRRPNAGRPSVPSALSPASARKSATEATWKTPSCASSPSPRTTRNSHSASPRRPQRMRPLSAAAESVGPANSPLMSGRPSASAGLHPALLYELSRRPRCAFARALGRGVPLSRDQRSGERCGRSLPPRASQQLRQPLMPVGRYQKLWIRGNP